jgi:hypothetical protein
MKLKKIWLSLLLMLGVFAITSVINPVGAVAQEEGNPNYREEEQKVCEVTGGQWVKQEYTPEGDMPEKEGEPEEFVNWECECPEGMELGMGACYTPLEDELEDMGDIDESTCEAGDGIWEEPNISTGEAGKIEGEEIEEDMSDTAGDDDDPDITDRDVDTDLEELGYCRCSDGEYWSKSEAGCVAYEKDYLCEKTAGSWDSETGTCMCLFEESEWEENMGCMPSVRILENGSSEEDNSTDIEVIAEPSDTNDEALYSENKFGYLELGLVGGVALFLGTGIGFALREMVGKLGKK